MSRIRIKLSSGERKRLLAGLRLAKSSVDRRRIQIVLAYSQGLGCTTTSRVLGVAESTAVKVASRYLSAGEDSLTDKRQFNGQRKVNQRFKAALRHLVTLSPQDFNFSRPTWTRELLIRVLHFVTNTLVSKTTISRLCSELGIAWKSARPMCVCPWSKFRKMRLIKKYRKMVEQQTESEPVFYSDEIDIHLNPKIGKDWMPPKTQKEIMTPGQNKKWYFAGAYNQQTKDMIAVEGASKCSDLYIELLKELRSRYRNAKTIHLIVDNYIIHKSKKTLKFIEETQNDEESGLPSIQQHFLPPYSPECNPIERKWQDVHANVTRNHQCKTIEELVQETAIYIAHGEVKKIGEISPQAKEYMELIEHL